MVWDRRNNGCMMESDLPPGSCNSTGHLSTIGFHSMPGRMHHSASTPAGVDGAGERSRTPPATPKKGGKMLAVRVQMLDDTISMFQIQVSVEMIPTTTLSIS
ncbi:hypothetical protein O0L34_g8312 [Tuta absoluta]|nr:hypothetical protein O0L34_g8312 [Tuta absoluta]